MCGANGGHTRLALRCFVIYISLNLDGTHRCTSRTRANTCGPNMRRMYASPRAWCCSIFAYDSLFHPDCEVCEDAEQWPHGRAPVAQHREHHPPRAVPGAPQVLRGSGGRLQDLPGRRVRPPIGLEGDVGPASSVGADGQQELGDQVRRARLHSAHALPQPVRDHGLAAGQREHRGSAARQFVSS